MHVLPEDEMIEYFRQPPFGLSSMSAGLPARFGTIVDRSGSVSVSEKRWGSTRGGDNLVHHLRDNLVVCPYSPFCLTRKKELVISDNQLRLLIRISLAYTFNKKILNCHHLLIKLIKIVST